MMVIVPVSRMGVSNNSKKISVCRVKNYHKASTTFNNGPENPWVAITGDTIIEGDVTIYGTLTVQGSLTVRDSLTLAGNK